MQVKFIRQSQRQYIRQGKNFGELGKLEQKWDRKDSFYKALRPVLLASRYCGMIPVQGLSSSDPHRLRFKLMSFWTAYCFLIQSSILWLQMARVYEQTVTDIRYRIGLLIFYFGVVLLLFPMFLQMSMKWPRYVKEWDLIERHMFYTIGPVKNVSRDCFVLFALISATYFGSKVLPFFRKLQLFNLRGEPITPLVISSVFVSAAIPKLPSWFPTILAVLLDTVHALQWLLTIVFVVLVATCLNARLEHFTSHLESKVSQVQTEEFWSQMRVTFSSLAELVRSTDDVISKVVLVSFFAVICVSLIMLSNILRDFTNILWRLPDFIFLLLASLYQAYTLSMIPEKAKSVAKLILLVPSCGYNIDVSRLYYQAVHDSVAISAWGFFYFTKTTFIEIIGTSLGYELVLIQLAPISSVVHSYKATNSTE